MIPPSTQDGVVFSLSNQVLTLFTRNFTVGKGNISEVVQPHKLTQSDKAGFQEKEVYLKYIPIAYAHRNE